MIPWWSDDASKKIMWLHLEMLSQTRSPKHWVLVTQSLFVDSCHGDKSHDPENFPGQWSHNDLMMHQKNHVITPRNALTNKVTQALGVGHPEALLLIPAMETSHMTLEIFQANDPIMIWRYLKKIMWLLQGTPLKTQIKEVTQESYSKMAGIVQISFRYI